MKNLTHKRMVAVALTFISCGAFAIECDNPKTSVETAGCLEVELRDADASINDSYKQLMAKLDEPAKLELRTTQRAWIKERDAICTLNTKENDREKWYQLLLNDYGKTVCVTRYTRKRTAELKAQLAGAQSGPLDAAPLAKPGANSPSPSPEVTYNERKPTPHSSGKWYFELKVNYGKAVTIGPVVLTMGVSDKTQSTGLLDNIRTRDASKDSMRYALAIDLDNGKLYQSRNGVWVSGPPGSNEGMDLKLGRDYFAFFDTSADSYRPYVDAGAFVPNFGDTAMEYALPPGYRPWRN